MNGFYVLVSTPQKTAHWPGGFRCWSSSSECVRISAHIQREDVQKPMTILLFSVNLMFIPNCLGEGTWTERGFLWWAWCSGFTALQAMTRPASVNKNRAQDLDTKCWSLPTRGPTMAETGRIIVETGRLANRWLLTESYSIACCLSGQWS